MQYPVVDPRAVFWPGDRVLVPRSGIRGVHAPSPGPSPGRARGTVTPTLGCLGELVVVLDRPSPEGVCVLLGDASEFEPVEVRRGAE